LQNGEIGKNFNFFDSELVSFSCDDKKNFSLKQAPSSKIETPIIHAISAYVGDLSRFLVILFKCVTGSRRSGTSGLL
jgi:hypothetical protein